MSLILSIAVSLTYIKYCCRHFRSDCVESIWLFLDIFFLFTLTNKWIFFFFILPLIWRACLSERQSANIDEWLKPLQVVLLLSSGQRSCIILLRHYQLKCYISQENCYRQIKFMTLFCIQLWIFGCTILAESIT